MGAYFPFFPIWLHDINHISKSDTGIWLRNDNGRIT
ncbi:MFS transporter [Escherichia coli]